MTDLLKEVNEQLDMDLGFPGVVRTPLYGAGERKVVNPEHANFYRVACNAGTFMVKAYNENLIGDRLKRGLKQSMDRVSHQEEIQEGKTLQEVLGLAEVDYSTLQTELITGALAVHYSALDMPLVTYLGTEVSTHTE